MNVMPFDELNTLKASLPRFFENGRIKSKNDLEELLDMLEDLFLLALADGVLSSNMSLSSNYAPTLEEVDETVNKKIAGKTWRERVRDYYDNGGTIADIERIAETETHRDANAGAYMAAKAGGASDIHRRSLPNGLKALKDLNTVRGVLLRRSVVDYFFAHIISLLLLSIPPPFLS